MSRASLAYPIAIGLAEGGWITVLYLLADAPARVRTPLGLAVFALAAGATCLFADRTDRLARRRLVVIVALLVGGGLLGIVLATLLGMASGVGAAIALTADSAAVLLGLAALRGFIRAGALHDSVQASRPFFLGLLGLSVMWMVGGILAEPMRTNFRESAVVPTVAFVVGGIAAIGLGRSELAAAGAGFDPRSNRSWMIALVGLAFALGIVALPLGSAAERIMAEIIAWPLSLPLLIVAAFVVRLVVRSRGRTLRRAGTFALGMLIAFGVLGLWAVLLPPAKPNPGATGASVSGADSAAPTTPVFEIALAVLAISVVAGVLLYLARTWRTKSEATDRLQGSDLRSRARDARDTDDEGRWGLGRRLRALARRGRPTDAVAAYLAALRSLEAHEGLKRGAGETPAAHARRLHEAGAGTLELDLLAADFELARWGGRAISRAEDRRAIGRWERLRARLAEGSLER